jgi:UDP-glucose 4-epimerase
VSGATVLITGAAGFIGSALCDRLDALGYAVAGYDDLSRGRREYLPSRVSLVEGDIRDGRAVDAALRSARPDCVVHLAAMHFIPECIARPADTMAVNVDGTERVLEACRRHAVRHFILASSAAVYAPGDAPCREEGTPIGPLEVYGTSKVAAEAAAARFHAETGAETTVLRLFNAIGRRETNPHVIPHIFESLQAGDTVRLGNLAPRRDYIDTRDIAEAIAAVLERGDGLRTFNVGTGAAHSVEDVVTLLEGIIRRPIQVVQDPSRVRATERMVLVAEMGALRAATDWRPRLTLADTLEDLAAAYGLQMQRSSTN